MAQPVGDPQFVIMMGVAYFKAHTEKEAIKIEASLADGRSKLSKGKKPILRFTWQQFKSGDLSKPIKTR